MIKAKYTFGPGEPFNSDLGKFGPDQQVVFKNTMQLIMSLQTGPWTNTLTAHYKSGYEDAAYGAGETIFLANPDGSLGESVALSGVKVPSYTTWDWQTVYNFSKDIRGTSASSTCSIATRRARCKPAAAETRSVTTGDTPTPRSRDLRTNRRQVLTGVAARRASHSANRRAGPVEPGADSEFNRARKPAGSRTGDCSPSVSSVPLVSTTRYSPCSSGRSSRTHWMLTACERWMRRKSAGVEVAHQPSQRFLVQIRRVGPQADVVVLGLEPDDPCDLDDDDPVDRFHRDAR